MDKVDRQTGVTRGARISRLILIANDGAPGFYSSLEKLHRVHGDRLLVITLDVDARTLGESLYGHGAVARALLVEHKDAVAAILLGLTWDDGSDI